MLNPKGKIFILRKFMFNYLNGALHICANGNWELYEEYETYETAVVAAEEIVDEYYAMCEPNMQVCAVSH
jgi:hypothetical protein|tara:strand:+ start:511 stop:720 length:210 start_codon:yes stop_codon:yes gene_type:complete